MRVTREDTKRTNESRPTCANYSNDIFSIPDHVRKDGYFVRFTPLTIRGVDDGHFNKVCDAGWEPVPRSQWAEKRIADPLGRRVHSNEVIYIAGDTILLQRPAEDSYREREALSQRYGEIMSSVKKQVKTTRGGETYNSDARQVFAHG